MRGSRSDHDRDQDILEDKRIEGYLDDDSEEEEIDALPIGFRPEARENLTYTHGFCVFVRSWCVCGVCARACRHVTPLFFHPVIHPLHIAGQAFTIKTVPNGHNSGRVFVFHAKSAHECEKCLSMIAHVQVLTEKRLFDQERKQLAQIVARRIVTSTFVQVLVSMMIASGFVLAITDSQIRYAHDDGNDVVLEAAHYETLNAFDTVDKILTSLFILELALNMTAYWFWDFWGNGWMLFDCLVVTMSVIELFLPDNMPGVKQIRVLRSFRIFRVFGRLPALRVLINSLLSSLVPLSYAFMVMLIFFGIFATFGVEMFHKDAPAEFATFARSFYTLFGVIAYGRWPDDKLNAFGGDQNDTMVRVAFIYSFVIVMVIVMLQVVVAVLLDNFFKVSQSQQAEIEEKKKAEEQQLDNLLTRKQRYHLDLFMEYLAQNFYSQHDLDKRINRMFRYLDSDRGGDISFLELSEGLFRLNQTFGHAEEIQRMTEEEYVIWQKSV